MNFEEQNYLDLMRKILETGHERKDRTGVGTKSIFGAQLRFSLENNVVPILTTKKVFIRGVIEELLFFIRGETNSKILEERGVNIWKAQTSRSFLDSCKLYDYPEGEMGKMYGALWRDFHGVDQLQNALDLIKNDPYSRRIMISAYDPSEIDKSILAPCHTFFQFYVQDDTLSCQWYQRSVDLALGFCWNVLSYAILTRLMAQATGLKTGKLIFSGGDIHCYKNHFEGAQLQLTRNPYPFPIMTINKQINTIEDMESLEFNDFEFQNYIHHEPIKLSMAV